MADIIQAAKWMQKGKRVRGGNAAFDLSRKDDEIFFHPPTPPDSSAPYSLDINDLLADDWEIAE